MGFSHILRKHKVYGMGAQADVIDPRDHLYRKPMVHNNCLSPECSLGQWAPPIMNQGKTSACTGFASAVALNIIMSRVLGVGRDWKINPWSIYRNTLQTNGQTDIEAGASLRQAMATLKNFGGYRSSLTGPSFEEPEVYNEYRTFKIKEYVSIKGEDIPVVLSAEKLPILASLSVFTGDLNGMSGILRHTRMSGFLGLHAVCLTGIVTIEGKSFIEFRNSWGTSWGNRGIGYLSWDYVTSGDLDNLWCPSLDYF